MNPLFKLIIAILLLLCLADMPYGFYTIVRFVTAAAFTYFSYEYFKEKRDAMGFVFAALALLFQPFFKFALGRALWNMVDVAAAAFIVYVIVNSGKHKK